jgi:hypothetical protein
MIKRMHQINIDFIKPMVVLGVAHLVTISNVTDGIKLLTAVAALSYAIVKLINEVKKK